MKFSQIDQITDFRAGESITAIKRLSPDEEYLKDHFPLFPVMPGVLMLEAIFQAAALLVLKSDDFAHSLVILKEARNVKYNDFVEPGETLTVTADIVKQDGAIVSLKGRGSVDGVEAVNARLILERFTLAERNPERGASDPYLRNEQRKRFEQLSQSLAVKS